MTTFQQWCIGNIIYTFYMGILDIFYIGNPHKMLDIPSLHINIIFSPLTFSYLKKSVILEEIQNIFVRSRPSRKQMVLLVPLPQGLIMLLKKLLVKMRRKRKFRPCRALILLSRMKLSLISSKCL